MNLVQRNLIEDATLKKSTGVYITFVVQTKPHGHGDMHIYFILVDSFPSGIALSQCWNYM
jgi:hypothetical protein